MARMRQARGSMNRLPGVDLFRILGILAVISIHAMSYHFSDGIPRHFDLVEIIVVVARFAIPYFFVTSGFFWGKKLVGGADLMQTSLGFAKRILLIFFIWSLIYLLPYDFFEISKQGLAGSFQTSTQIAKLMVNHPARVVLGGTATHLWFLPSLLICVAICACFLIMRQVVGLMVSSILLYIVGVLSSAYLGTPLGFHLRLDTTRGPCLGLALFASGYILSTMKPNHSWLWKGWLTLIVGLVLHFSELLFLRYKFGIISLPEYVFGTYFMGVGSFLIALSIGYNFDNPNTVENMSNGPERAAAAPPNAVLPWSRSAGAIGQLTLGVYVIHLILMGNLGHFRPFFPVSLWDTAFTPFIYMLSLLIVFFMSKSRILKPIVV
jgi:surface polysaccharide O-acyltransferase-like enzyme